MSKVNALVVQENGSVQLHENNAEREEMKEDEKRTLSVGSALGEEKRKSDSEDGVLKSSKTNKMVRSSEALLERNVRKPGFSNVGAF